GALVDIGAAEYSNGWVAIVGVASHQRLTSGEEHLRSVRGRALEGGVVGPVSGCAGRDERCRSARALVDVDLRVAVAGPGNCLVGLEEDLRAVARAAYEHSVEGAVPACGHQRRHATRALVDVVTPAAEAAVRV